MTNTSITVSDIFAASPAPLGVKLDNFAKYVRRQSLARFLARYELFKLQLGVVGSIIECGVHHGGGLLGWAQLSSALEPYALHRRVYGFDTFEGFPAKTDPDTGVEENPAAAKGHFHPGYDVRRELDALVAEHDRNRYLSEFRKVFMISGDANQTIPAFVEQNPHLLISLLFMDFDLYEPTRTALLHFSPRMCRGAIIAFDQINNAWWPGETRALLDTLGVSTHRLQRFPMDPNISYLVL
jgi:hypothetical protein